MDEEGEEDVVAVTREVMAAITARADGNSMTVWVGICLWSRGDGKMVEIREGEADG